MREVPRLIILNDDPLDKQIADAANHFEATVKHGKTMIDKLPCGRNLMDGPKQLHKTGHDIMLARRDTIHDRMAKNPDLYESLKREFGSNR